ncbi:MAG: agmatinase [SAR202 cluster bacterium]|nr:agmatinase [SAR202 cluster bacterium]
MPESKTPHLPPAPLSGRKATAKPSEGLGHAWPTFLALSPDEADLLSARVVLLPVPYDGTTSYMGGARYGPRAIITASAQMEDFDLELDRDIAKVGIFTAPELVPDVSGPEAVVAAVRRSVAGYAKSGKVVGVLGGEHSVTVGAVRAFADLHPNLSVLYFDAHADLRDEYMGSRWSHACAARRVLETCPVVHVGVRSLSEGERRFIRQKRLPVTYWPETKGSRRELSERLLDGLSENVYVSVDLDVLDPSLMPAVGTPEPGGMSWGEVTGILKAVGAARRIVGFDVMELSPREGPESCAYTAAKLTYKLIGYATSL